MTLTRWKPLAIACVTIVAMPIVMGSAIMPASFDQRILAAHNR